MPASRSFREDGIEDLLVGTLLNIGVTQDKLGRLEVAVGCYDRALKVLGPRIKASRQDHLTVAVAKLLTNKGIALDRMQQPAEAMKCHDEAISVLQPLVDEGRTEFVQNLASMLINDGVVLSTLGQRARARTCFADAERYLASLGPDVPPDVENQRAGALMNQGVEFWKDKQGPEALACQEKAVSIRRHLVDHSHREFAPNLAVTLSNKSHALLLVGQPGKALACSDEAVTILKRLIRRDERGELVNELANALLIKGTVLHRLNRPLDALPCFSEAVQIRQTCLEVGMTHLAPDLLEAMIQYLGALLWLVPVQRQAAEVVRTILNRVREFRAAKPVFLSAVEVECQHLVNLWQSLRAPVRDRLYVLLGDAAEELRAMVRK